MFIQTEPTPNPATMKFLPGRTVMATGTADFPTLETSGQSPLAQRLFAVEGVTAVFLGGDFVTVTRTPAVEWHVLKPAVLGALMEHFASGEPVMAAEAAAAQTPGVEDGDEVVAQICELLETRVRPAVAMDGGDIIFQGFEDGVVYLHLQGSCAGCPMSTATLKMGIENMLRHYIPEVAEVRAV